MQEPFGFDIVVTGMRAENGQEKVTAKAKEADELLVSFEVGNRIAQTGETNLYVIIIGPDGKPVYSSELGSGTFTTRDMGDTAYTLKVSVGIAPAKETPVKFAWKNPGKFQKGNYKIENYHNGFKIGEAMQALK